MPIRARENLWGAWAFLLGIVTALVAGVLTGLIPSVSNLSPYMLIVLAVLGIIAGYFVVERDVQIFLLASVSVVIVCYMGISGLVLSAAISGFSIGTMISSILQSFLALFVPATIVVAIKTVFAIASR